MRSIHDWLCSEETGEAFHHCVRCKFPLLEIAVPWLVNKEFHRGECTLEYAICQSCRDAVTHGFSEESKAAVRGFLEREIDWESRLGEFMRMHDLVERFDSCVVCAAARDGMDGYGISALFDAGGHLVEGSLPLLICRPCIVRMTASLSAASLETWKRFLDRHFDGPPDDDGARGFF
jgi:hypothetical protein